MVRKTSQKVTPTTYEGYRYTLKILQDYFKDIEVEKILPMDVEDFLESLADEGRSQSGIAGCRAMMHQIMGMAVANGLIDRNPVRYAEKMHYEDSGTRRDAFSDEEVRLLMEQLLSAHCSTSAIKPSRAASIRWILMYC